MSPWLYLRFADASYPPIAQAMDLASFGACAAAVIVFTIIVWWTNRPRH